MRIDIKGAIVSNDDKWIYRWFDMDSTCPRDVDRGITAANGEPLDVYINSGGGDIFAGSEIYAALKAYKGEVNIHVVGLAASAASVIMCAGKSDIISTGMVMVHNVSSCTRGDYHQMDKSSEVLQKANRAIATAYTEKTGKDEKEVLALMDRETWLTAAEAVESGLVDSVTGEAAQLALVASFGGTALPREVIEKVRNTVKNPFREEADLFMQKAQAQLALLSIERKQEVCNE